MSESVDNDHFYRDRAEVEVSQAQLRLNELSKRSCRCNGRAAVKLSQARTRRIRTACGTAPSTTRGRGGASPTPSTRTRPLLWGASVAASGSCSSTLLDGICGRLRYQSRQQSDVLYAIDAGGGVVADVDAWRDSSTIGCALWGASGPRHYKPYIRRALWFSNERRGDYRRLS